MSRRVKSKMAALVILSCYESRLYRTGMKERGTFVRVAIRNN